MKRKISLCFLLFLFLCVQQYPSVAQNKKQSSKPNVIIILMDDMGYGDPTCYNGMSYQTPLIDQLAAEGMRFTNFYAAQPVCSASRAGLLTGCYPNRIGIAGALMPWAPNALNPKEETIASLLKQVGYSTAMVGKWHLGSKAPSLPVHFGFDDFFGLPYSNDMWPVNYDGKPITNSKDNRSKYPPLQLLNGDTPGKHIATLDDQGTLTKSYTEHAVDFIKKINNIHSFCTSHIPWCMCRLLHRQRSKEKAKKDCLVML